MKALILNSGLGRRMGDLTSEHPKCMTVIDEGQTIIERQLNILVQSGISDIVITTGPFEKTLIDHCNSLGLPVKYNFIKNPIYDQTNYIYSIYLARSYLKDDIVLMHGDLVFDESMVRDMLGENKSSMTISTTIPLPEKDFKAVVENDKISMIGVDYFDKAVAAQPLYKLNREDWLIWLEQIKLFCESNRVNCYAENAFNEVSNLCIIRPYDVENRLCNEVDTAEDLKKIIKALS